MVALKRQLGLFQATMYRIGPFLGLVTSAAVATQFNAYIFSIGTGLILYW